MEPVSPFIEVMQLEQHLWARCIKHRITYVKEFLNDYETNPMSYGYNPRILQQVLDALISIVDSAMDLCNRIETVHERKKQDLKENLEIIYIKLELFKNRVIHEMHGAKSYALAAKAVADKQAAAANNLPAAEVAAIIAAAAAGGASIAKTEPGPVIQFEEQETSEV